MTWYLAAAGWSVGHGGEANADAFDLRRETTREGCTVDLAVADGASTTLFAGMWAAELVGSAVGGWAVAPDDEIVAEIERLRRDFSPPVDRNDRFVMRKWSAVGSQATLAAVRIEAERGRVELRAMAVGDSEVAVVAARRCAFFPLERSDAFNSRPELITTRVGEAVVLKRWSHPLALGDLVLLASDAVAKRLLELHEGGGRDGLVKAVGRVAIDGAELDDALTLDGHGALDDDATLVVCGVVERPGDDLDELGVILRPATERRPSGEPAPSMVERVLDRLFRRP